jgi:hypothetical protein
MQNKDNIRNLLIDSVHSKTETKDFFKNRLKDEALLNILIEIAIDDYSGDARMEASYWISQFEVKLLNRVESSLLVLQKDELDSIACHSFIALAKINSKDGLDYIIENRIRPEMYWEAEALKIYLSR